jgi:hypothetical protein
MQDQLCSWLIDLGTGTTRSSSLTPFMSEIIRFFHSGLIPILVVVMKNLSMKSDRPPWPIGILRSLKQKGASVLKLSVDFRDLEPSPVGSKGPHV